MCKNKEKVNEFKSFLIGLIKEKKLGKDIDLNKAISEKYNVELSFNEGVSSILIYGDTVCEDNKKSLESALNCWLDSDVLYECDEINIKLRKNNYCCSFSYSGIINRDLKETYIVPTYKFINDNYTNDCFIDFNGVVEEKEFLSNFPMGRSFDSFSNKTILDAAWSKKDTLQEDESLNYYIRYITNQVGYGVKYLNIQEITEKIGHSLIDHGEYIEIKDYDNKLFRIYKVDNTKVDFDTIEAV